MPTQTGFTACLAEAESLESGLERFKQAMLAKFKARDRVFGERSVVRVGDALLKEDGVYEGLWEHFEAEVQEMRDADHIEDEIGEAVDVGNMAFLIWWRDGG